MVFNPVTLLPVSVRTYFRTVVVAAGVVLSVWFGYHDEFSSSSDECCSFLVVVVVVFMGAPSCTLLLA
jgi:hypothetical protein